MYNRYSSLLMAFALILLVVAFTACNVVDNSIKGDLTTPTVGEISPLDPNPDATAANAGITINRFQFESYSALGFQVGVPFSGDSNGDAYVTLYYCNQSVNALCDPKLEDFVLMTRTSSSYTALVNNFTMGYTDTDQIKIRAEATDADGVTGSPQSGTAKSSNIVEAIVVFNLIVNSTAGVGFSASLDFTGDSEHNGVAVLYYCNETDNALCDPLVNDSTSMTLAGNQFIATVTGLTSPYDQSDLVKILVVVSDPNGTIGSPILTSQSLTDLEVSNLSLSSITKNSVSFSVDIVEQDLDGTVDIVYCNNSDAPGCDPLAAPDGNFALTRVGSVFEGTITGFPVSYDEGEEIHFAVAPADPDGASIGSNTTVLQRLADSMYSMFLVSVVAKDFFFVTMPRQSGGGGNATVKMYICDSATVPGCDPLASVTPTDLTYLYLDRVVAQVDTTSIPKGNTINLAVEIIDPDGVYAGGNAGSPAVLTGTTIRPNPNQIYRSVGPGQTGKLVVGSIGNTLSVAGSTATIVGTGAIDLVGQGDALFYDSDGNTSIDSLAFIEARGSNFVYTLQAADGSNPNSATNAQDWFIYRAYTSLADGENGVENPAIVADPQIDSSLKDFDPWVDGKNISTTSGTDEDWNLVLYAGLQVDQGSVSIGGWTRDRGNEIKIFTAQTLSEVGISQGHNGEWDASKYILRGVDSSGIWLSNDFSITIRGLQIELTGSSDNRDAVHLHNSFASTIERNIIKNSSSGLNLDGIECYQYNGQSGTINDAGLDFTSTTKNNIIYGFNTSGSFAFRQTYGESQGPRFHNNVIYDNETGVHGAGYRSLDAINNVSIGNILADFSSTIGYSTIKYNIDSDGSANSQSANSKTANVTEATPAAIFTNVLTYDFTLTGGSPALDTGFNLSATINFDVVGATRVGPFDRGVYNNP